MENTLQAFKEANPELKFVSIVFAPYTGRNTYDYATDLAVAVGDYVVVETPTNGYTLVKVKAVKEITETSFSAHYSHKFIVCTVARDCLKAYQLDKKEDLAKMKELKKLMFTNTVKAEKRL